MGKTKVLVVGLPSARMHCVVEKLCQGGAEVYSYCPIRHPGLLALSEKLHFGGIADLPNIIKFAREVRPDLAFIDPEIALGAGVVDALAIPCVGPTKSLAQIETSKSFARKLIKKYKIGGNPEYYVFIEMDGIKECLEKMGEFVIKPDGLTGGKGVKVSGEHLQSIDEALAYCEKILETLQVVVTEEKLAGEEFTIQAFCDGHFIVCAPPVRDHKRAYENDKGPNTGSMGSYAAPNHSLPFLTTEDVNIAKRIIFEAVEALQRECGETYKGIIYGAFMKTKKAVQIIEFNARFGDPESVNILAVLETDFLSVCKAMVYGRLDAYDISFANKATVCKYVVPTGYPNNSQKGFLDMSKAPASGDNLRIYYGDVEQKEDGALFMRGSRAVLCVGIGDTIAEAEKIAEDAAMKVDGAVFHRSDIGTSALIKKSVNKMCRIMKE